MRQRKYGPARSLLEAVVEEPLGQIEFGDYQDMALRVSYVCNVFPEARILIAAPYDSTASSLCRDLVWTLGVSAGEFPEDCDRRRCLVTTLSWLPQLNPERWQIVLTVVFHTSTVTPAICLAAMRMRARRKCVLIPRGLRMIQRNRLRLEAMSGGIIDP